VKKVIIIIIIFLTLLAVGVVVMFSSLAKYSATSVVELKNDSYLVLDLDKSYPEKNIYDYTFFSDFSKKGIEFWKLIRSIEYSATDSRIKALIIKGNGASLNRAQAEELFNALSLAKTNGKKIIGYAESLFLGSSYIYGLCDEFYMPSTADIYYMGLSIQPLFYKGLFDKIGVGYDVVQKGRYKGGMENFIRKEFSEPFTEAIEKLLEDFYGEYRDRISDSRGISKERFDNLIDKGIIYGDSVMTSGLVDGLLYLNEFDSLLESQTESGDFEKNSITLRQYAHNLDNELTFSREKIALIIAEGMILPGKGKESPFGSSKGIYSTTLSETIDELADDDDIAAIVLRIDSGGGSSLASDIIWNSVKRAKSKKPFVVSMASAAASGGYYIAMAADTIFADNMTLTGSIGVYGGKPFIDGLMDKTGITSQSIKYGEYAEMFTLQRKWNEKERALMMGNIDHIYEIFITKAAEGRTKDVAYMDSVAQGRIWSGKSAAEIGLVDRIGGIWDAVRCAQKMAKISLNENPVVSVYPKEKGFFAMISEMDQGLMTALLTKNLPIFSKYIEGGYEMEMLSVLSREPLAVCPVVITGDVIE